jgi:hypothetical protein
MQGCQLGPMLAEISGWFTEGFETAELNEAKGVAGRREASFR